MAYLNEGMVRVGAGRRVLTGWVPVTRAPGILTPPGPGIK
jgi:hypothetical protein